MSYKGRVENLTKNLKHIDPATAFEIRSKGGKASGPARKLRNEMKRKVQMLLELPATEKNKAQLLSLGINPNDEVDNMLIVAAALFKEAAKGNIRAIEQIAGGFEKDEAVIKRLEAETAKYKEEIKTLKHERDALLASKNNELSKLDELLAGITNLAKEPDDETDA